MAQMRNPRVRANQWYADYGQFPRVVGADHRAEDGALVVPNVRPGVDPPVVFNVVPPREGFWDKFGRTFKQAVMRCFCFGEEVALWERQRAFDRYVAEERVTTLKVHNNTATESVVDQLHLVNSEEVHHVPRFVGHVVDALRIKLGMGAADRSVPGNVALVRAEAARMMRDWNVRHRDAAAHLVLIERAFFTENVHERPTTWRVASRKASRLLRFLLDRGDEGPRFDY
jgi:hypothetical protein